LIALHCLVAFALLGSRFAWFASLDRIASLGRIAWFALLGSHRFDRIALLGSHCFRSSVIILFAAPKMILPGFFFVVLTAEALGVVEFVRQLGRFGDRSNVVDFRARVTAAGPLAPRVVCEPHIAQFPPSPGAGETGGWRAGCRYAWATLAFSDQPPAVWADAWRRVWHWRGPCSWCCSVVALAHKQCWRPLRSE
jgi:hypothetical protein